MRDANGAMADAESELECCNLYHSDRNSDLHSWRVSSSPLRNPKSVAGNIRFEVHNYPVCRSSIRNFRQGFETFPVVHIPVVHIPVVHIPTGHKTIDLGSRNHGYRTVRRKRTGLGLKEQA